MPTSTKPKKLSTLAIAAKLKAEKTFWVGTDRERRDVLAVARYLDLGVKITTRACVGSEGFNVYFINSK